jgi:hypothetical protein
MSSLSIFVGLILVAVGFYCGHKVRKREIRQRQEYKACWEKDYRMMEKSGASKEILKKMKIAINLNNAELLRLGVVI